jgi:two-component system chemotaxis response regulator CheB
MTDAQFIVVLTASAGGLKAISHILSHLPKNFSAPIVIVQHLHPQHPSMLAQILKSRTPLLVTEAKEKESLCPGTVYIAPSNQHLLINPEGTLSLSSTEKVHNVRPSADVLFLSAATSFTTQVIAVVLTGMGSDGAMGVEAVKKMGGAVIAQNKETSEYFSMPEAAIKTGSVDYILPLEAIAPTLWSLVMSSEART